MKMAWWNAIISAKAVALFLTLLVVAGVLASCSQGGSATPSPTALPTRTVPPTPTQKGVQVPKRYSAPPPLTIDPKKKYTAAMYTSKGTIVFELLAAEAPKAVNNFVFLAREGFYDGVIFHRIIKGFMVQSGDPTGTGSGGPGYQFADEPVTRDYVPGTLAMANAGPNTNGSQFFIMHGQLDLPKNYTIFGRVMQGMEVVDALANTPVTTNSFGERSKPITPPAILRIEITETSPSS